MISSYYSLYYVGDEENIDPSKNLSRKKTLQSKGKSTGLYELYTEHHISCKNFQISVLILIWDRGLDSLYSTLNLLLKCKQLLRICHKYRIHNIII